MVNITENASIALLNKPVENVPRHTQTLIYFMLLAAIAIARKSSVIDIALMKWKLTWVMLNEKVVSVLGDEQPTFDEIWSPWLAYLQVPGEQSGK